MASVQTQRRGIVTPEAVVLEFETAGVGSRLVAGGLDAALQAALFAAVMFGFGAVASTGAALGTFGLAIPLVAVFLILFGYPAGFETLWRGRTPGKAALGLRVVTVEGAPIRFRHAAIRAILALVDWHISQGAVGVISLLVTRRNQRLGDLVAGTIVLRERTAARATAPVRFEAPPGLEAYAGSLSTAAIGHEEYGSVRSFLLRAPTLPPHVRADLASQLAYPLLERLRTTPPPGVSPETFLLCVAAAFQRRMDRAGATVAATGFSSVWTGMGDVVRWATEDGGAHAERPPSAPLAPAETGFSPPA